MTNERAGYRGRLAPSPTGFLHLGHARTFWVAQERALAQGGTLVLRNEDLDAARCKPAFVAGMFEDLLWFGFKWQEGPDCGGSVGPYTQSERRSFYEAAFDTLRAQGHVYPCTCSRRDVQRALRAPHAEDEEPIYPGTCRPRGEPARSSRSDPQQTTTSSAPPSRVSWRFRLTEGETISFVDQAMGPQAFVAGRDFGDFVVWRPEASPAYQLAVVVDDAAMGITEVVRGNDLLLSTARQLLLYRALRLTPPRFYHCSLVADDHGQRLAKRHDGLSLRALREAGKSPAEIRGSPAFSGPGVS